MLTSQNAEVDKIVWKCNGCGAHFESPEECHHCGASHCPECKRTNTLMNVTEFRRVVSHSVELRSQMKKRKSGGTRAQRKDTQARIDELMKATERK